VCVSVALVIQRAMCMRHIATCGLSRSTMFPYHLTKARLKKGFEHKMCFDFLYNLCLKHFSFYEELSEIWSQTDIGLHVKYPLFL
jgi:hypothetical protein